MNSQIQGLTSQSQNSTTITQQATASSSQYAGRKVMLSTSDYLRSLLEGAEEISMQFGEKAQKRLNQRKLGKQQRSISDAAKKASEYLRKVPDLEKQQKLDDYIQRLKKNPRQATEQFRRRTTHTKQQGDTFFSDDPTLQYAAMAVACESFQEAGDNPDLVEAIESALAQAFSEQGPAIRAGLNVSEVAEDFSQKAFASTDNLRKVYRDSVLDYGGLTATYQKIVTDYGTKNFEQYRQFLLKALSADMSSEGSSIALTKLKAINDDMGLLKVLGGLHEQCHELICKMQRLFNEALHCDGQNLMSEILDLKDKSWLHVVEVENTLRKIGVEGEPSAKIYFLTALYQLVYLLPEKTYETLSERENFLNVTQQALDNAILQEEQELEI